MQRHRLSKILEDLSAEVYKAMRAAIAHNGCVNAEILTYQGQILEGWHRYRIAKELDMIEDLVFVDITEGGMDPVSVVCSQNLFSRYLSVSQRAQIAVELSRWIGYGGDRRSEDFKRSNDHLTNKAMAANAGVSEKSISRAKTVKRKGLEASVISGEKTANEVINEEKAKNTDQQRKDLANDLRLEGVCPNIVIDLSTETIEELDKIQPPLIEDAFVFIWATPKNVPDPFKLLQAWRLTYFFIIDVHKGGGIKDHNSNQFNDAFILIGAKGNFSLATVNKLEAAFQGESAKRVINLQTFYDIIRRLTREPRLLMLSPKRIEGFHAWQRGVPRRNHEDTFFTSAM